VYVATTYFLTFHLYFSSLFIPIHSISSTVAANLDLILSKNLVESPVEETDNSKNSIDFILDELYDTKKEENTALPLPLSSSTLSVATPTPVTKSVQLPGTVRYDDSIVICGSDSDILLQAMILSSKFPNIRVLQSGTECVCSCSCVYCNFCL
jgi:hypothetical protein